MTYFVVDTKKLTWEEVSIDNLIELEKANSDLVSCREKSHALELLRTIAISLLPKINSILNEAEPTVSIKMDVKLPLNISQAIVRTFIEENMANLSDKLGTEVSFKINFV